MNRFFPRTETTSPELVMMLGTEELLGVQRHGQRQQRGASQRAEEECRVRMQIPYA